MLVSLNNILNNKSLSYIWFIFFLYSVLISFVVQLIILPYFVPFLHSGNGQLVGGDWANYQARAVFEFNKINELGWEAWQLRPSGWGMTGLISAIYSLFGSTKPYLLIPLYSLLHSIGALCIVMLIEKLGVSRFIAFVSALPYLLFPTSLLWLTQILKDVFTLNGSLLILYGLVMIFGLKRVNLSRKFLIHSTLSLMCIFIGIIVTWLVRPYMVSIFSIFIIFVFAFLNLFLVIEIINDKKFQLKIIALLTIQIIVFSLVYFLPNSAVLGVPALGSQSSFIDSTDNSLSEQNIVFSDKNNQDIDIVSKENQDIDIVSKENQDIVIARQKINPNGLNSNSLGVEIEQNKTKAIKSYPKWEKTKFLPTQIDYYLSKLYSNRVYFNKVNENANTSIYGEKHLNSLRNMILFIPKAAQISFFAPFPSSWFADHPSSMSKILHKISGFEMALIYISLIGTFFSIAIWRQKIELWIMISFSLYFGIVYSLALPNIGTLIRYRYSAIMILVALGLAAAFHLFLTKKRK
ncbi:hypothetical protein ACMAZA_01875 [Pseudothioglobus sp. nBUS_23]|uniref:hypothetical protein n=1 Tax=Pseudothioglobus sp. nBUS_23 TaxID=3395318 RepID=UPI003EBDAB9F